MTALDRPAPDLAAPVRLPGPVRTPCWPGSLGLPIPNNLLILAAGGLPAEGDLDLVVVLAVVFVAAILGDGVVFALAWWLGEHAVVRHRGAGRPDRVAPGRGPTAGGGRSRC